MKRKKICIIAAVLSLFMSFYFTGCVDNSNKNPIVKIEIDPDNENYIAEGKTISGKIQIELYPEKAPNSVAYFLDFIAKGIYNNFPVSKVMHGGVVQFGDPWMIKQIRTEIDGEFKANGFEKNDIVFKRGTVALDLFVPEDFASASGDFFILLDDEGGKTFQDKYAAIGEVVSGIELLDTISGIKNYTDNSPIYSLKILTTTVDLKGQTYEQPITQDRRTFPGYNTN